MPMNDVVVYFIKHPETLQYLTCALGAFGVCAFLVANVLPVPTNKESAYGVIYSIINMMGQNYGKAKNLVETVETAETEVSQK